MATKEKKSSKSDARKAEKAERKAAKAAKAAEEVTAPEAEEPEAKTQEVDMVDAADETTEEPTKSAKRKADIEEIEIDVAAPEPPSKRARRALKKGKVLPAKADSDDEKKEEKKEARSEHGVWIGNLRFTVTPAELRTWLIENSGGVILDEHITRVKLPTNKEPGRDKTVPPANKGFAYVDFAEIGPKVAAIALSETEWHKRKLLIKDSKSFEGRPKKEKEDEDAEGAKDKDGKPLAKQEVNAIRKIFVGNMSFKTTEDDVRHHFEKCGEIDWVKVATFEDTGKCKGFGWVMFREPEAAAWAVKGFVKIKEAVETEDDFKADDGSSSDEDDEEKEKEDKDEDTDGEDDDEEDKDGDAKKDKKQKKKATKKKAQQQQQKQFKTRKWWVNRIFGRELKIELAEDDQARYRKRFGKDRPKPDGDNPRGRPPARKNNSDGAAPSEPRPLKTSDDIQVARLTGAVVKHTGSKMTFD